MATSPTSYLQTLTNDEAIAFVASLQSVKAHLSQELQWITAQAQQKTVQLQGIETLLSEASALKLVGAETTEKSAVVATPASIVTAAADTHESAVESSTAVDGNTSLVEPTEPSDTTIATLPTRKPSTRRRDRQQNVESVKTPRGKTAATTKTNTAEAKSPKASMPPAAKAQRGKASGLQRFLQSQFRDKSLTESVGEILNRAAVPLSTDDVMAALYDGLPKADYNRAKNSVTNILSVGRSKGTWKSTGRGRYAGNAVATT